MSKQRKRRPAAWLCTLTLWASLLTLPVFSMTLEPGESSEEASGEAHFAVELQDLAVEEGQRLEYLTVDPTLAGNPFAEGYYPGELTLKLTGQIVVRSGGELSIGKYAVGGPEPSPVLEGSLSDEGLIRVETGGVLRLNGVTLDLEGEGVLIYQEPGSVVELFGLPPQTEELCRWGGPTVDDRYVKETLIPLAEGSLLREEQLPRAGKAFFNDRGKSQYTDLPIRWDVESIGGKTEGEAVIEGTYLDGEGTALPAVRPLQATVRWYPPEEMVLLDTVWTGSATAAARLYYTPPEEELEFWGEVSEDGGKSWEHWEACDWDKEKDSFSCTFFPPDDTQRQYRIGAADASGERIWFTKGVTLPEKAGESDDQGGNRGGSTSPVVPSREPEEEPDREPEEEPDREPDPSPRPAAAPQPTAPPEAPATPEPTPAPTPGPAPAARPPLLGRAAPTPSPGEEAFPQSVQPEEALPPESASIPEGGAAGEHALTQEQFPVPTPVSAQAPTPVSSPEPHALPVSAPAPTRTPEALPSEPKTERSMPTEAPPTESAASSAEPAPGEEDKEASPALQTLLVLLGLAACAAGGLAAARRGHSRGEDRKR